jgi:hypothetical protein
MICNYAGCKVWSLDGSLLGTLRQGEEHSGKGWNFKIDFERKQMERHRDAISVMHEIDNEGKMGSDEEDAFKWGDDFDITKLLELEKKAMGNTSNNNDSESNDKSSLEFEHDSEVFDIQDIRKTPKLIPVSSKLAGKGFSSTPSRIKLRLKK